ncbi:ketopantoate reductase family protein [Amycolatopsis taiwanensis]|uniref:ketopantoate reductase family protein n=1 Tax=Amycolatopsis taiwanensis TaxID=342230 RepID=UPI0024812A28|nr:ketopantoate reductase C-terminal domain-containing protein [Amycolatopsis taiwanensis]
MAQLRADRAGALVLPDDFPRGEREVRHGLDDEPEPRVEPGEIAAGAKLIINVVTNSLTALTGRRMEMLGDPGLRAIALDLAAETASVARAAGVPLTDARAREIVDWISGMNPDMTTSMLQDRQAGRPLEHDGLLGPVVTLAERHGVPALVTTTILRLLRGLPR